MTEDDCVMIEEDGILYGSCQASLIEDVRMSHDTSKFVLETGAVEEGNVHFCDFLLYRTDQPRGLVVRVSDY